MSALELHKDSLEIDGIAEVVSHEDVAIMLDDLDLNDEPPRASRVSPYTLERTRQAIYAAQTTSAVVVPFPVRDKRNPLMGALILKARAEYDEYRDWMSVERHGCTRDEMRAFDRAAYAQHIMDTKGRPVREYRRKSEMTTAEESERRREKEREKKARYRAKQKYK
ncbi:MAG: hypothetical protein INR68_03370 [Methylobacterium mesophilicum]|nr:hypothetical protein [Methylobacterium mesophilicum]